MDQPEERLSPERAKELFSMVMEEINNPGSQKTEETPEEINAAGSRKYHNSKSEKPKVLVHEEKTPSGPRTGAAAMHEWEQKNDK